MTPSYDLENVQLSGNNSNGIIVGQPVQSEVATFQKNGVTSAKIGVKIVPLDRQTCGHKGEIFIPDDLPTTKNYTAVNTLETMPTSILLYRNMTTTLGTEKPMAD
ncbi:hypothetical protein BP5796_12723 [Coleophoma crateriformis]|uniref:Uncharacterized protein n=1 Tax=Coleophoma crateriformis TaxID=565419 RepID=A0A3D8Q628_9HELO|nr:hypothetical protein BP5796_12723 [Coleophoma crateriformis]